MSNLTDVKGMIIKINDETKWIVQEVTKENKNFYWNNVDVPNIEGMTYVDASWMSQVDKSSIVEFVKSIPEAYKTDTYYWASKTELTDFLYRMGISTSEQIIEAIANML